MKNITIAKSLIVVFISFLFQSCVKSLPTPALNNASKIALQLAVDPTFVRLNDALNHFDPRFLQLINGDQRSTEDIIKCSKVLFEKWKKDTNNLNLQRQVATFYHFNSLTELNYYSNQIIMNLSIIKNKYFSVNPKISEADADMYFRARSIYAKNKMDSIQNTTNKIKTNSMYDDYILNPEPPAFQFFASMDVEDLNASITGSCLDACCLEWRSCRTRSRSDYLNNSVSTNFNTIASGAVIGGSIGAVFSPSAGITGAFLGAYYNTIIGTSIAIEIYSLNLQACDLDYKACIQRKKGN